MLLFGAAAQLGIFVTIVIAAVLGFDIKEAASIGIIGAADGPTSIYVPIVLLQSFRGISVAAYSYMALVPIIQPRYSFAYFPKRASHKDGLSSGDVPRIVKVIFPLQSPLLPAFLFLLP